MKPYLLFFIILCLSCQSNTQKSASTEQSEQATISKLLSVVDFQDKIGELEESKLDFQIIDVRTPKELESDGYLFGSTNINYNAADFKDQIAKLDHDQPVLLYCKSGGRSGKTRQLLKEQGFTEVYDMIGGITEWKRAELVYKQP